MYQDWWNTMRRGDVNSALAQMKDSFEKAWKPEYRMPSCTSEAMELGAAYLWLRDFEAAREHFDNFNRQFPGVMDCTYDMAGVARWCLGDFDGAVAQWRLGLNTEFADAAGGTTPRLLLYFASALQHDGALRAEAEKQLASRTVNPRWDSWPRPIAEFILGRIDVNALRRSGIDERNEDTTLLNQWQVDFWSGVVERSHGNEPQYLRAMKKCGQLPWDDFDQCQDLFIHKLWSPEFYLARHEAEKAPTIAANRFPS